MSSTVIVIVFISFCGVFFLACLVAAFFCFMQKKEKTKKKKSTDENKIMHVDEHLKVKEAIVPGPHGPQAVVLEIEDDLHFDEIKSKDHKVGAMGPSHASKSIEKINDNAIGGLEVVEETHSASSNHQNYRIDNIA